jgi:hypothetical protein
MNPDEKTILSRLYNASHFPEKPRMRKNRWAGNCRLGTIVSDESIEMPDRSDG